MTRNVLISVEGKTLGKGQTEFLSREKLWESCISKRLDLRKEQRAEAERKLKWDRVWVYILGISIKTETENRLWNTFDAKQNTTLCAAQKHIYPRLDLHTKGACFHCLPIPLSKPDHPPNPPTLSLASLSNCDLDSCFREKTEAVEGNLSSIPSTHPHLCLSSARCKHWAITA